MKTKITDALKTRYKNLGFGDKAFEGVAEHLSRSVTKDEEVEAAVTGAETLLKAFQGDIDKRVQEAIATAKAQWEKDSKKTDPIKTEEKKPAGDGMQDAPEWVRTIQATFEKMNQDLESLKVADKTRVQHTKIKAKLEEAKVPEKYYSKILSGRTFKDDAEIEAVTTEIVTDWEGVKQTLADEQLGQSHQPLFGSKSKEGVSPAVQQYVAAKAKTQSDKPDPMSGKKLN